MMSSSTRDSCGYLEFAVDLYSDTLVYILLVCQVDTRAVYLFFLRRYGIRSGLLELRCPQKIQNVQHSIRGRYVEIIYHTRKCRLGAIFLSLYEKFLVPI